MTFWEFLSEHILGVIIIVGIICASTNEIVKEICDYKRDIHGIKHNKKINLNKDDFDEGDDEILC